MYFAVFCRVVFFGMQQSIAASCIWTKAPCQLHVPSDQLALPQQTPAGSRKDACWKTLQVDFQLLF
jgi:hypothetical protein